MVVNYCFSFITDLHSFHVYRNTVSWNPCIGQEIYFKCELNSTHDKCAVRSKAMLPWKIAPAVFGHVPKELSKHIWFAIQKGAKASAIVETANPQPLPLLQGGLEILISMKIEWYKEKKNIQILKEKKYQLQTFTRC